MKRILPLLALLFAPAVAPAQIDAEVDKPYLLQVVLRCGAHNWLGEQFRNDLRGDLAGMLVDALGSMAEVNVIDLKKTPVDQWQPIWKDVDARGLGALDSVRDFSGGKAHFLRVDFVNGQYEIQARQIDGQTGLVSPWRIEHTPDRAFVARLAGKLIAQDFGLIGTVIGKGEDVRVRFKASQGAPLDRWIANGDAFALMQVAPGGKTGGSERVYAVPDTVVRVTGEPKNGEVAAKVVCRFQKSAIETAPPGTGFRCIKIGAGRGPMRLRLVDDKGQPHTRTLQVRVHSEAFQTGESRDEEILNPDRGGLFVSKKLYDQVAYARIVTGARQIAKVPVIIQDNREMVVKVGLDAEQEQTGQLQAVRGELRRQYDDSILVQINSYKDVSALVKATKNELALQRAKAARKALEDDVERLGAQKVEVKKQLANTQINVDDCDKAEEDLKAHKVRINRLIGQLEETERLANAPDKVEKRNKLQALNLKATNAVDSFDFDTALSIYRQIVQEFPEETAVKQTLDKLEKDWEIKSNEHADARTFVSKELAALKTAADLETKLPQARKSLQALVQVQDQLTILKLRSILPEIGKVLRDEATTLAQNSPDDAEAAGKLKKIVTDFDKFGQDVEAALKTKG